MHWLDVRIAFGDGPPNRVGNRLLTLGRELVGVHRFTLRTAADQIGRRRTGLARPRQPSTVAGGLDRGGATRALRRPCEPRWSGRAPARAPTHPPPAAAQQPDSPARGFA